MHTLIQFYLPADVDDRVDREGEEKKIKHRNMHTLIHFYSPSDVDDRVDREGENRLSKTVTCTH